MLHYDIEVNNPLLKENLIECIKILGGKPEEKGVVSVDIDESDTKLLELIQEFL